MKPLLLFEEVTPCEISLPNDFESIMPDFSADELAAWSGGLWNTMPNPVLGICHDTRALKPMNLYVALSGDNFDGHIFVDQAFEKGASAALVKRSFAESYNGSGALLAVDDTLKALQAIATGYRG
ncbi:MAG: Mur ligase domain-containing protein [Verrucomicrobiota bacterium]